jgi:hypothetical protein
MDNKTDKTHDNHQDEPKEFFYQALELALKIPMLRSSSIST